MANEKSKSLIRLLDKANELSRCLAQETADRSGFWPTMSTSSASPA